MIKRIDEVGGFKRTLSVSSGSTQGTEMAEAVFNHYQKTGVVQGEYQENSWTISNQITAIHLDFSLPPEAFEQGAGLWSGCNRDEFLKTVKSAMALELGVTCISTLAETFRELMRAAVTPAPGIPDLKLSPRASGLLCDLPNASPERDLLLEASVERRIWSSPESPARRLLADLDTFLLFEKKTRDFYESATEKEKILWFPVVIWVDLSFILPLRPTEFILLPRDCIQGGPGNYTITIRRTLLKKHKGAITYRIDGDYKKDTYPVPDSLAREILFYVSHTSPDEDTDGTDQLFAHDGPFTYADFRRMLKSFAIQCLNLEDEADLVLPGCSRHLAMIGLIMAGGSPDVCRVLAGHETVDQASWYFGNLYNILQGAIMRIASQSRLFEPLQSPYRILPEGTPFHNVTGGRCTAMEVPEGDVSPCLQFYKTGRRPDLCSGCPHFYPYKEKQVLMGYDRNDTTGPGVEFLFDLIEELRSHLGKKETLRDAMNRMKSESARILEQIRGEKDAQTKEI